MHCRGRENVTIQWVVKVPDSLVRALDARAKRLARTRSEVVRMAIQQYMDMPDGKKMERASEKIENYFGSVDSGIPDLATQHRKYIIEILQHKQRQGRL